MSFLTLFSSTSHHLKGRKMQFARAAKENGMYPRQSQVAEVAIVCDWEEFGRSGLSSPAARSAEYIICCNLVQRNILPGTSTLLSLHGRTKVGTCVCMAWPWVAETMWKSSFAFLKELAVIWVWALIDSLYKLRPTYTWRKVTEGYLWPKMGMISRAPRVWPP